MLCVLCMCNLLCVSVCVICFVCICIFEFSHKFSYSKFRIKKKLFTSPIVEENFTIKNRRKCKFQELTFDQFSKCLLKHKNTDVYTQVIILASNTWLFAAWKPHLFWIMIAVLVQSDPDHKRQEQKFQIIGRTEGMLSNWLQNFQYNYHVKGI